MDRPETILSEEAIYQSKKLTISIRQVALTNGTQVNRPLLKSRGAVVIAPLTQDMHLRLIRQYRVAADKWLYELPAGNLEADEHPDAAAPRELLEETGDTAEYWQKLGGFYSAPNTLTEFLHLYLAQDLTPGPTRLDFDEHIEVLTVPWAEAMQMLKRGDIQDAKSIAGLMLAAQHLKLSLE